MGECRGTEFSAPGFFMKYLVFFRQKLIVIAAFAAIVCSLLFLLLQPCLFVETDRQLFSWYFIARDEEAFSLRFIHSVEKTPVIEKFKIDDQSNLVMFATEYESFGVGLPFLASEGHFYAEGNRFILEMNRVFPSVSLRTGPEAQLILTVNNNRHELYKMLPSGTLVRLSAGTWLSRLAGFLSTY